MYLYICGGNTIFYDIENFPREYSIDFLICGYK